MKKISEIVESLRHELNYFIANVKKKLKDPEIYSFSEEEIEEKGRGFYYKGNEYIHHSQLPIEHSAFFRVTNAQLLVLNILLCIILLGLIISTYSTIIILFGLLTLLYSSDLLFNAIIVFRSYVKKPEVMITDENIYAVKNKDWPTYTILCPLYKEWEVLSQFIIAMSEIDYPKEKLQVILLLEESDDKTIRKVQEFSLPYYFDIKIVPDSLPKTKPKALNYGLQYAKGEYIVVYDAEDIPEVTQIKKAVLAFERSRESTICIQAKLNFYNTHLNLVTKLFTAEYSLWFDLVLTGLQSINAPIPLGGTSNHFRKSSLLELHGWDSFNVTEDCDLGMRIARAGLQTALINSTTNEEANSNIINWLHQRSRWIKGYIQTYLVHIRSPESFFKNSISFNIHKQTSKPSEHIRLSQIITGITNFFVFHLIVGGKITSMFINPLMWLLTIIYFLERSTLGIVIASFFPTPLLYTGSICMIFGNFLYFYFYMMGAARRREYALIKYVFFIPFYWLMMSTAAWMAVYSIITQPHYWAKTKHGYHFGQKISDGTSETSISQIQLTPYPAM